MRAVSMRAMVFGATGLIAFGGAAGAVANTRRHVAASTSGATPTCARAGITATNRREGTCVAPNGKRFTFVNRGHVARLEDLSVRLAGFRLASILKGPYGARARAQGRFMVVKLTVWNRSSTPQTFPPAGVLLSGIAHLETFHGVVYTDEFKAENGPDPNSFVGKELAVGPIQPGLSESGDIVFDLPRSVSPARTVLVVFNFRDAADNAAARHIAVLRTT